MIEPRLLRPLGYADLVNEAFDLYKRNVVLFAGVPGVIYLPFMALVSCLSDDDATVGFTVLCMLGLMLAVHGAMVKAIADRCLGLAASIPGIWRALLRRLFPFLVTSVMAWATLLIGFSLCWIPGVIFSFWIFFLWPVMELEGRYYFGAFPRSRDLAAGLWGRILVTTALIWLLTVVPIGLLVYASYEADTEPPAASASSPGLRAPDWEDLAGNLLFGAMLALGTPLPTALSVLLYLDVRVRKEGFDVEWLFRQIEASPSGDGPPAAPS